MYSDSPVALGHPLPDYEEKAKLRRRVAQLEQELVKKDLQIVELEKELNNARFLSNINLL